MTSQILKTLLTEIRKLYINDTLYKYFKRELKTFERKKIFEKFDDVIKISKNVLLGISRDVMLISKKKIFLFFAKRVLKTVEKISCIFAKDN